MRGPAPSPEPSVTENNAFQGHTFVPPETWEVGRVESEETVDRRPTVTVLHMLSDADVERLRRQAEAGGTAFSTWRTWDFEREMQNRKNEATLEEMANRLRCLEEKLRRLEDLLRREK